MSLKIQLNCLQKVMASGGGQEESECQEVQEGLENYRPGKVTEQKSFWEQFPKILRTKR